MVHNDTIGTGRVPLRYLGVGLDLGTDPPFGPFGPHVEINRDRDPAQDGTVAFSSRAPDVLGTGSAAAKVRYTVTLDRERIAVHASSDHDCFGGGMILEHEHGIPATELLDDVMIGFIGASGDVATFSGDGRVGIGASDPAEALHVAGNALVQGAVRVGDGGASLSSRASGELDVADSSGEIALSVSPSAVARSLFG